MHREAWQRVRSSAHVRIDGQEVRLRTKRRQRSLVDLRQRLGQQRVVLIGCLEANLYKVKNTGQCDEQRE